MTHDDMKVVAYYRFSAYSTSRKKDMSVDQFFGVRDLGKKNKKLNDMIKKLKERT